MKATSSSVLLALGLASQQVTATWLLHGLFPTPENCNNVCNPQQKAGFSFQDLGTGSFNSYCDLGFHGFSCLDKFPGLRKEKRTLGLLAGALDGALGGHANAGIGAGVNIGGSAGASVGGSAGLSAGLSAGGSVGGSVGGGVGAGVGGGIAGGIGGGIAGGIGGSIAGGIGGVFGGKCILGSLVKDIASCPKIDCGAQKAFSITDFDVSVDVDTDVECHYEMPDHSICMVTESCKKAGSHITNDQCGGAISVQFKLPDAAPHDNCNFGIHSIKFDCNPPVNTVTPGQPQSQVSPPSQPTTPTTPTTTPSSPTTVAQPPVSPPSNPTTTPTTSPTEAAPTTTPTTGPTTGPTTAPTTAATSDVESSPASAPSSSPTTPTSPGDVLPKCLNTWMHTTPCQNNADISCYCPNGNFTDSVMNCIQAWGGQSGYHVDSAFGNLAGICAQHIVNNPGLVTNLPSGITLGSQPSVTTSTVFQTSQVVVTSCGPTVSNCPASSTVTVTSVVPVSTTVCPVTLTQSPLPMTTVSFPNTITSSSTTTVVTTSVAVPQVQLITQAPAGPSASPSFVLSTGAPPPAPAPAPAPTAVPTSPVGASPVAPTTFSQGVAPISTPVSNLTTSSGPAQVTTNMGGRASVASGFTVCAGLFVALLFI